MSHLSSTNEDSSIEEELPPSPESVPNADTEDDEKFCEKAILFVFDSEKNEWNSRGSGMLKILQNRTSKHYRYLMRENQTYRVRMSHLVPYLGDIRLKQGSNREVVWTAFDSTGESEVRQLFTVRFAFPQIAESFITISHEGQKANKEIIESSH